MRELTARDRRLWVGSLGACQWCGKKLTPTAPIWVCQGGKGTYLICDACHAMGREAPGSEEGENVIDQTLCQTHKKPFAQCLSCQKDNAFALKENLGPFCQHGIQVMLCADCWLKENQARLRVILNERL